MTGSANDSFRRLLNETRNIHEQAMQVQERSDEILKDEKGENKSSDRVTNRPDNAADFRFYKTHKPQPNTRPSDLLDNPELIYRSAVKAKG